VADRLFPTLRERDLVATDKSRHCGTSCFGQGDRLPGTHPAAAYRGAFGDSTLLDPVQEPVADGR
jgi:hypothetical protein